MGWAGGIHTDNPLGAAGSYGIQMDGMDKDKLEKAAKHRQDTSVVQLKWLFSRKIKDISDVREFVLQN
jgi:hypothetical protein